MKTFFLRLCIIICFILLLQFALTSKYIVINDPALWAVLLIALYVFEPPKRK